MARVLVWGLEASAMGVLVICLLFLCLHWKGKKSCETVIKGGRRSESAHTLMCHGMRSFLDDFCWAFD